MNAIDRLVVVRTRLLAAFMRESLPPLAREEMRRDRRGLAQEDPGIERVIEGAMAWLCEAQDNPVSADAGVARDYSLIKGWSSSYPETTGYIVSTFLEYSDRTGIDEMRIRARRMLDWLVSIQLPCGGFQGGKVDSEPIVPVAFNTGQILLGLASGDRVFNSYRASLRRAADWLVKIQDPDGCWRRYSTPFARPGEKTFDTHVAWALLEAARIEPERGYEQAALANIRWAISHQRDNGWLEKCCLNASRNPLTHTIGYALRGLIEGYRYSRDSRLLEAARRTADGVLTALRSDGFLPGRLAPDWSGKDRWACLTGTAQMAICWFMLFQETGERLYRQAAFAANSYVRRTVRLDAVPGIRGGVKGSFPINGDYGKYEYLSWAAKFMVDSLMLEQDIRAGSPATVTRKGFHQSEPIFSGLS
jgi:hypothetical protein